MGKVLLVFLFMFFSTLAFSQQLPDDTFVVSDSLATSVIDSLEVAEAEEEILFKEDTSDYVFFALPRELEYIPGDDDPLIIGDRLSCIEQRIPLVYNDKIHAFINYFTVRDREYTRLMMRRKNLYFPLFEKYLAKYDLPDELKYLAIIESGLNPKAISRARAVGLWQFMSATGRYYGLNNNWYIDERMDPEKATDAACRYLRDLHRMFNDWELALAAYNTGPGNVRKAIRRSGNKKSFWEIYPFLPRETRSYVPQFVAMIYTMNHLEEHNFFDEGEEMLVRSDTLHVRKFVNFETLASLTGTCVEDLQKLNPSVQHNAIPDMEKTWVMRIPVTAKEQLTDNRVAILDSASRTGRKELEVLAKAMQGGTYGRERIVYKVRSGDVLGSIAMRHKVKVSEIKQWNNLRSDVIRSGQRLNIWVKGDPALAVAKKTSTTAPPVATIATTNVQGQKTYTVQPGDTLWDISRKFDGLTIEKIKSLNKLPDNKIRAGQMLVVSSE